MSATLPKAFAVPFSALRLWSVRSFFEVRWDWPAEVVRPLGEALDRRIEAVRADADARCLLTIQFDGSVSERTRGTAEAFKGKLFRAEPGDLVYSKIDVRNGAIGLVPETLTGAAVSAEYPVYAVRRDVAVPEYMKLLARTQAFRRYVNGMVAGASGRKRVTPELLESIRVPLPALDVQRAIVARAVRAEATAAALTNEAVNVETSADGAMRSELSIPTPTVRAVPKALALPWSGLDRWGIGYLRASLTKADLDAGAYPVVSLGSMLQSLQYGTSTKANTAGRGLTVLRMNNLQDGVLDLRKLKHVELSDAEAERITLNDGDILINRTNSKELVGKCAVFREPGVFVYASYLIRARLDTARALPDYVTSVVNGRIGRHQIDTLSRQIGGQANINSEEIRSLRLPLPPLDVQQQLVDGLLARRADAARLRADAVQQRRAAQAEVEAMILGTAPAP